MARDPSPPPLRTIGRLSAETGVKVPTIRFYEKIGLLEEPPRTASDRRLYDGAATRRLAFIRHARQLGFEIDDIRALLALSDEPDQPCTEVNRIGVNCVSWSKGLNEKVIARGLAQGCEAVVIGAFIDTAYTARDGSERTAKELVINRLTVLDWAEDRQADASADAADDRAAA